MRCLLALSLAAHAAAQLVIDPAPQNLEALLDEFKDDEAAENLVLGAGPGLQEPTICDPSVKQHSGLLDAGNDTKYFFWLFESRSSPSTDPLVIWLTGGPGCSSTLALLAENGPCTLDGGGKTTPNPHSWNSRANVLWLDQPQSTGFSTGKLEVSGDEDETVEHFYTFLMNFYKALPQYKKNGLYISGESYGGHWVPAVAHRVWQGGLANAPLKGILIGNGLTNPEEQYNWYWKMAQDGGKTEGGTLKESPVGRLGVGTMRLGSGACVKAIGKCNDANSSLQGAACSAAFAACAYTQNVPYQLTGYNPYDMRIKCEKPPLCYDFSQVTTFLNTPEVQKAIGATKKWASCNLLVNKAFTNDFMKNYHRKIPDLLSNGVRVLIYAGDVDFICNWLGNKHWTLKLDWSHKEDFNAAEEKPYLLADGKTEFGKLRQTHGLAFLQVYQAGHMVPMDKPEAALTMLNDFISEKVAHAPEEVVV
jgi:cathepsin A (carboxypeptidase C)